MAADVTVELADLRGWARQVDRAAEDMACARRYATQHIADADFGRILELITGPYAGLISSFHTVLAEDSDRLAKTGDALESVATAYREADARASGQRGSRYAGPAGGLLRVPLRQGLRPGGVGWRAGSEGEGHPSARR